MCNNATEKKVTIKRRGDGVYDVYVGNDHAGHRGSVAGVLELLELLLLEE